jgi:hypothetical protein
MDNLATSIKTVVCTAKEDMGPSTSTSGMDFLVFSNMISPSQFSYDNVHLAFIGLHVQENENIGKLFS